MTAASLATLALLAVPAPEPPPAPPEPEEPPRIAAALWCEITEGEERAADDTACDGGLAGRLFGRGPVSPVGFLGSRSLGMGLAWTLHRPESGPVFALGAGVAVPWSLQDGIDISDPALVAGVTVALARQASQ